MPACKVLWYFAVGNRFIASAATEAFASLAFENYHTRWPAKWAIKSKEAAGKQLKFVRSADALANVSSKYYGINVLDEKNKAFRTKWSDPASGQKQYAGWSKDGFRKHKTLFEAAKNGRITDENRAMEDRILQELRESEGITANTWVEHQRQKNRKRSAEIVADDEEVLDLLSDSEDDVH